MDNDVYLNMNMSYFISEKLIYIHFMLFLLFVKSCFKLCFLLFICHVVLKLTF